MFPAFSSSRLRMHALLGETLLRLPQEQQVRAENSSGISSSSLCPIIDDATGLQQVSTSSILSHTAVVAVVFAEPGVRKCNEALAKLTQLAHDIQTTTVCIPPQTPTDDNNNGRDERTETQRDGLAIVVISMDTADSGLEKLLRVPEEYNEMHDIHSKTNTPPIPTPSSPSSPSSPSPPSPAYSKYLFGIPPSSPHRITLARVSGLSPAALLLPEIIFFDAFTGEPISTEGAARLNAGQLQASSFPLCCRSNCFTVRVLPANAATHKRFGPSFPSAQMEENTLLDVARLYPGDLALVRPIGRILLDRHVISSSSSSSSGSSSNNSSGTATSGISTTTSAAVYVNATLPEDDDEDDEDNYTTDSDDDEDTGTRTEGGGGAMISSSGTNANPDRRKGAKSLISVPSIKANEIHLPIGNFVDLGLTEEQALNNEDGSADSSSITVALQSYLDMPVAKSITVTALSTSSEAMDLSTTLAEVKYLAPWFGVASGATGQVDERKTAAFVEALSAVRGGANEKAVAGLLAAVVPTLASSLSSSAFGAGGGGSSGSTTSSNATNTTTSSSASSSSFGGGGGRERTAENPVKNSASRAIIDAAGNPLHAYSPSVQKYIKNEEMEWLQMHVRQAACKHIPVATGGTLAIPVVKQTECDDNDNDGHALDDEDSAGGNTSSLIEIARRGYPTGSGFLPFRILETEPRHTAVIVGSDTRIRVVKTRE